MEGILTLLSLTIWGLALFVAFRYGRNRQPSLMKRIDEYVDKDDK
jgi:hypothetical protein